MNDTCPLNRCDRPLGVGTHMSLAAGRDGSSHQTVAICEDHWQALRPILPVGHYGQPTGPTLPDPATGHPYEVSRDDLEP